MTIHSRVAVHAWALSFVLAAASSSSAQTQYAVGQNIVPVFEGWERNADGTFTMAFGYLNRNYVEEPNIPIGPDNTFQPGDPDRGQPAHFYPRRQQFVFKVTVPKDFGNKELVWTLTAHGKTEKAYGSLLPVWEIGDLVYQENRGAGGLGELGEPNQAPSSKLVGDAQRTIRLQDTLTLTVEVSDDGHPIPRPRRPPAAGAAAPVAPAGGARFGPRSQAVVKLDQGVRLGVTWIHYRGPGKVTFDPMRQPVTDGKATTKVSFSEPGTYVIRAYADDGILLTPVDVTVTVSPGSSAQVQR